MNDKRDQSEFETWFECGPSSTNRLFSRSINKQIRTIPLLVFDRSRVFEVLIMETVNNKKKKKIDKKKKRKRQTNGDVKNKRKKRIELDYCDITSRMKHWRLGTTNESWNKRKMRTED